MSSKNEALAQVIEAQGEVMYALEKLVDANTALVEALREPTHYITAQEYAKRFTISVTTVYRKVRRGEIKGSSLPQMCGP